jgi:hypothetical protein
MGEDKGKEAKKMRNWKLVALAALAVALASIGLANERFSKLFDMSGIALKVGGQSAALLVPERGDKK